MYFTGERYAKFIQTIVAEKSTEKLANIPNGISQDDEDRKQKIKVASDAIKHVFINRIEPINCGAKLVDVWPIEKVWGILKQKLRGREYSDIEQLKNEIKKQWNISISLCQQMIDKLVARLKLLIDQGGNQIQKH